MKKIGAILSIAALLITMSASICFADSLTIIETYPKDGSTGASIENLGVKVYFSNDMTEDIAGKVNKDAFQLYDEEGDKLPTRVLYNDQEEGVVLVLLDTTSDKKVTAKGNTEYTLKISGNLQDDQGNTLGKDTEISFKTLNQKTNTMISMGMMVLMFGGMIIVTTKSAAKKATEDQKKKEEKVNPYKEAKKTGKSVEEIVAKDEKRKAKQAEKEAREALKDDDDDYEDDDVNKYRVKRRHSASEAGSRYVAAKKEAAEKARAQKAKNKTASKGKKKKK